MHSATTERHIGSDKQVIPVVHSEVRVLIFPFSSPSKLNLPFPIHQTHIQSFRTDMLNDLDG